MKTEEVPQAILKGDDMDDMRVKAYEIAMEAPKVMSILQRANDAKTIKSLEKKGVYTGVLYMAPGDVSGCELCPKRTKGCSEDCLFTAGHGTYTQIKIGRLRKTYQFLYRRDEFINRLHHEVGLTVKYADKHGFTPAIRLNATSDIAWEVFPVANTPSIFHANPGVQFYDYTKVVTRLPFSLALDNYNLTFSYAETKSNRADAELALDMGVNVAVVFDKLPETFTIGKHKDVRVIDGDETDVRFWDVYDEPVIIGLLPKGKARKSMNGFVIRDAS